MSQKQMKSLFIFFSLLLCLLLVNVGQSMAASASNPVPADGATGVNVNTNLSVNVGSLAGTATVRFYGREVGAAATPYTVVAIPDTQHYADNAVDIQNFVNQANWIISERVSRNIVLVDHLGDIVDSGADSTQWNRARGPLNTLSQNNFAVGVAPGNHDYNVTNVVAAADLYDYHFPATTALAVNGIPSYQIHSWYGGYMGDSSIAGSFANRLWKNNYVLFEAGGVPFINIAIEYDWPGDTIAWTEAVLDAYPDRQAIISTHSFLTIGGSRTSAANTAWNNVLSNHCNVFLVLSGHAYSGSNGEARLTSTNDCGQPVYQLLSDYQGRVNGGQSWLRYMAFDPANDKINVFTYSPTLGTYETDSGSQFTLDYKMGFKLIGTTTVPGTATTASITWAGRNAGKQYEWYAVVDDGTDVAASPISSFTTAAAPNWTAYADLRSSVGDFNAVNVLEIPEQVANISYTSSASMLVDKDSGVNTDATLQLVMNGINTSSANGGAFTSGPAFDVFNGIVDAAGVYSFNEVGDLWRINFAGLDPSKRYEVAVSTNRAENLTPERWTQVSLLDTDSSVEASGGTTTIVSPTVVRFASRYNTVRGDLARWNMINPGTDGDFSILSELYLAGGADRSYAPVLVMIREFDNSLPVPPVPSGLAVNVVSGTALSVTWNDVSGETNYDLAVGPSGGGYTAVTGSPLAANTTSFNATGLTTGTKYCYVIQATNTTGASGFSSEVCATPVVTVTLQDGSAGYTGTRDTYIYNVSPATARGAEITMVQDKNVADDRTSLLRFDLSSIPAGAAVSSAELQFYVDTEGQGFNMYRMLQSWDEATVSYTSLGGRHFAANNTDAESAVNANWPGVDTYVGYITVSVPAATIQDWIDGILPNNGWLMIATDIDDGQQLRTREHGTVAHRPKLTLTYVMSRVWDGGGADNNWSTAANWVGDTVPSATDWVRFNGTSSKNATIDTSFGGVVGGIIIDSGYSGNIDFGRSLAVSGNYRQESGTVIVNPAHAFTVNGRFTHNGGTLQETQTVSGGPANFLQIQTSGGADVYRGVDVAPSVSLGSTTVTVKAVDLVTEFCTSTTGGSPASTGRCFNITPTTSGAAAVTLWALTSEVPASPRVYHYTGGVWQVLTNPSSGTAGSYTWVSGDTTSFSPFLIGGATGPTAVSLQSFTAETGGGGWLVVVGILLAAIGTAVLLTYKFVQQKRKFMRS